MQRIAKYHLPAVLAVLVLALYVSAHFGLVGHGLDAGAASQAVWAALEFVGFPAILAAVGLQRFGVASLWLSSIIGLTLWVMVLIAADVLVARKCGWRRADAV